MKIGESKAIKAEFDGLNDFVSAKQFNYGTEKETRALIRSYPKRFGLSKKEILAELKNFVNKKLTACPLAVKPTVKQKYAKIIISEEFV
ncbi:hypothetical protein COX74_00605 [bacterium (Candidatus Gribaldobacteria) CG_4_10_14_0_2_um_filter_41_16]|uniref:Uncharacterized protein n=3 Tax=Candidatus Gribaldobacteria TaxID=2798536 RepID=A0A2M7VJ26_9BACT|nr:MAG: hypothetical protein AUJ36_04120 [Parcubacteria group bacterium CG1_02_41_26]PIV47169.1 MAG: hypothetical protein COS21_01355 [bacterium (Candidatus Gribaldobacteria) CG02_land_8_20_14_3_00_41_15]PIX03196.1 MAG: hypothetical protein COZ78_01640 [bacterium (Candidatus Gribaldobacteria) CG_4_8_14_3_um_filter_42_11]PJA01842.1 MAG: hypothetical protein COX74_00605 [bacterium (Candidatus Gribaldobacteria) CG_4_10_14_0_2_um_filter_41_16]